jgi:superfamily II DNA/RNA helicase
VLAPVRELAIQINLEALRFAKPLGLRCCCLYGGAPKHNQINSMRGGGNAYPHLIVATPGRLLDLCKPQTSSKAKGKGGPAMSLANVEYFVLDEADRMLDLGVLTFVLFCGLLYLLHCWPKKEKMAVTDLFSSFHSLPTPPVPT